MTQMSYLVILKWDFIILRESIRITALAVIGILGRLIEVFIVVIVAALDIHRVASLIQPSSVDIGVVTLVF